MVGGQLVGSFKETPKNQKLIENMESNKNSDGSEEEKKRIIREEIDQSRANRGENLCEKTQAMILQATSALAFSVNIDSGIPSPLDSSTSPSINLTVLAGLSEPQDPSNLTSYPPSVSRNDRQRQLMHPRRLKSTT